MSEQSIYDKSVVIRNETEEYANTRGRVADILDDINGTKANKEDVNIAINAILNELDITEADLINYINQQNNLQDLEIAKKVSAPTFVGKYILEKTMSGSSWKAILMNQNQMPFWNNGTFENSPVYVVGGRIGIGEGAPTESLHVNGSVRADTCIINQTTANTVPNKMWSDGTALWFTNGSGVNKKQALVDASPTVDKIAILTPTGTLKAITSVPINPLTKVYGENSLGVVSYNETVEVKKVDTSNIEPTILQLIEKGVDRVDYPNLGRIYFNYGTKWGYITLTEVMI